MITNTSNNGFKYDDRMYVYPDARDYTYVEMYDTSGFVLVGVATITHMTNYATDEIKYYIKIYINATRAMDNLPTDHAWITARRVGYSGFFARATETAVTFPLSSVQPALKNQTATNQHLPHVLLKVNTLFSVFSI